MTALLDAHDVRVRYRTGNALWARLRGRPVPEVYPVDGVDLAVEKGASVGLVGESGCGKTTLAKALVGLLPLAGGSISLGGVELDGARNKTTTRRIQMVFQDPGSSLNPALTIRQTLRELLLVHSIVPAAAIERRLNELLDMVELPRTLLDARPRRLSGGQRQRVGIARALALEPDVLVADESVAALDVSVQASVLNLLSDLRSDLGLALIFISHDLGVVRHISDRVVVMYEGRVVEDRPTDDVFAAPAHAYTEELIAAAPRLGRSGERSI